MDIDAVRAGAILVCPVKLPGGGVHLGDSSSTAARADAGGAGLGRRRRGATGTGHLRCRAMPEVRVDPLTGLKSIVTPDRATRPGGGLSAEPCPPIDRETDPFLEGHEDRTPPEVFAVRRNGTAPDTPGWSVRVVPNLYPALDPSPDERERSAHPDLFTATPARGMHEVVINAPDPVASLAELDVDQVVTAVEVWRARMRAHSDEAAYVHVIVNERREAGASLPHTHAQIYAMDFVPAAVARERERFGAYAQRTMGGNLLQDLVQEEVRLGDRIVAIDDEAVLMVPYGARFPYQLMLAPRRPRARFDEDGPTGAALLHDGLSRLARRLGASPPLNLWVRTAPRGADRFCWRIDVVPRLTQLAGLELGTGVYLNIVAPERAAADLRAV
ncbi:MAG: UDPglucose--hexose-phosphate uridylyltransferase [Solirubrobacteraceae bacterium]|nr:UDPglucose--hexose-phosphate uridylyltransferase [Solirubrobacteraceae bacterium]